MKRDELRRLAGQFRQGSVSEPADDSDEDVDPATPVDVDAAFAARMAAVTGDVDVGLSAAETATAPEPVPASAERARPQDLKHSSVAEVTSTASSNNSKESVAKEKSPKVKTTVMLHDDLVAPLREWTASTNRSNADAVLTAYLDHMDVVRARHVLTPEEIQRINLGLAPRTDDSVDAGTNGERGGRRQVGLYVSERALGQLDTAADELALTRSDLVCELLDLQFRVS